jgi:outer membrane protease
MKKLILLTLLLMLIINTLSFAQETEKPKKERNWIVGIGWAPPTLGEDRSSTTWHYNATVGYKGFTVSYYMMPTEHRRWSNSNYDDYDVNVYQYLTVGYQHVFSKKSNAEVKPIVGFEYGLYSYFVNTGIRYKRSQLLLSMGYYNANQRNDNDRLKAIIPFVEVYNRYSFYSPSITMKYQFLL